VREMLEIVGDVISIILAQAIKFNGSMVKTEACWGP